MLVCAALIPGILNLIPLASLAAILFVVGYKLAHPLHFKQMYQLGWDQFLPFLATIIAILVTDLLIGILIGTGVSVFFILKQNYGHSYWLHEEHTEEGKRIRLILSENVSFLNKGSILKTLRTIPADSRVLIDGSQSMHIAHDVREILHDFCRGALYKNIDVELRLDVEREWAVFPGARVQIEPACRETA